MTPYIDTYERILTAARELIHARSYADVGVAAICEQAKVKKGSFYHFFPSKQELTLAILDSLFVETKEQLFDQVLKKSDLPPLVRLQKLGAAFYTVQSQIKTQTGHVPGCPIGNLASEMSTQDETIRRKIDSIFQKLQSAFQQILTEAVAIGDCPPIDITATAQAMFAYIEGVMLLAKTQNDPEILRQLLPAITQIRIHAQ